MSLLKLPVLLLSTILYDIALNYPSAPHPDAKIIATSTARERMLKYAGLPSTLFLKSIACLTTAAETIAILGQLRDARSPDSAESDAMSVLLNALGPADGVRMTVPFVLGALLVSAGGIIRFSCFQKLGPYFTFVQCIHKDHRLITTGPYAVVRHPGYTSLLMSIIGWGVMQASPGSWLRTSGILNVPWVRVTVACWYLIVGVATVTMCSRATEEDQFLSERFEKEWEDWARRVRYKLVPFVY